MKKKFNFIKLCNVLSIILIVSFIIKTVIDYVQYLSSYTSAPFYLWILVNALFFIIPSIILFVVGILIKKKK